MRKCPGLSADARSDLIKASALINTVDRDFVLTKSKLFFFFSSVCALSISNF